MCTAKGPPGHCDIYIRDTNMTYADTNILHNDVLQFVRAYLVSCSPRRAKTWYTQCKTDVTYNILYKSDEY